MALLQSERPIETSVPTAQDTFGQVRKLMLTVHYCALMSLNTSHLPPQVTSTLLATVPTKPQQPVIGKNLFIFTIMFCWKPLPQYLTPPTQQSMRQLRVGNVTLPMVGILITCFYAQCEILYSKKILVRSNKYMYASTLIKYSLESCMPYSY